MFRTFYLRLLLALAFVLGQACALAHATQHELDSAGKTLSCEICAVAHSGGGVPASAPSLPLEQVPDLPVSLGSVAASVDGHYPRPPSRGPPLSLS